MSQSLTGLSPSPAPGFVSSVLCDSTTSAPGQNLSLPLRCRGLSFRWISSHTTSPAQEPHGAHRPVSAMAGHLQVAGGPSRCSGTQVAPRVLQRGLAESRAQGGVGVQDSMGCWGLLHIGEGVLPILQGGYPHSEWDHMS